MQKDENNSQRNPIKLNRSGGDSAEKLLVQLKESILPLTHSTLNCRSEANQESAPKESIDSLKLLNSVLKLKLRQKKTRVKALENKNKDLLEEKHSLA